MTPDIDPDILTAQWDVAVIGSGVGGGLVSRRLVELGLRVLILEKGKDLGDTSSPLPSLQQQTPSGRLDDACWPEPLIGHLSGRRVELEGVIGAGVGGTSLRYAATLERPEPHDLDDSVDRPHPTGGWPVSYADMAPYFKMAEEYFCISGDVDPLASDTTPLPHPPRPLTPTDKHVFDRLKQGGLNPYQTHMAAKFKPGCENCFGTRCPKRCKMDGRSAGVLPALASGRAALLANCTVLAIDANDSVNSIKCEIDGQVHHVTARAYVLAAGGLGSPSLLLRSKNEAWPDGIGNRNDLVGRNLMFHLSEILAVWPGSKTPRSDVVERSISFRDLYHCDGHRFGLVQSMGLKAGYGEVLYAAQARLATSAFRKVPLLRAMLRVPAYAATKFLGSAHLFVGILEDYPDPENRLVADLAKPDQLEFRYVVNESLEKRRKMFRGKMWNAYKGFSRAFVSHGPQLNFAHPCGTVRFGLDPRTSVLDRHCRVHGVDNLFVVDSSFMPTSNGVNPSLTIAANALRVAEHIKSAMQ